MKVITLYAITVPVPGLEGFGALAPQGVPVDCSDATGAALIAAGLAVDGSEAPPVYPDPAPPPVPLEDEGAPRLPYPIP